MVGQSSEIKFYAPIFATKMALDFFEFHIKKLIQQLNKKMQNFITIEEPDKV